MSAGFPEIIRTNSYSAHNLVLVEGDAVWLTFCRPWWDLIEQLRWRLTPGRRRFVLLRIDGGHRVRVEAKRISRSYMRLG